MAENTFEIEIKSVSKSFGYRDVLKDLNLNVKKGEFLAVFGPNGAGKTTLIRIISTLTRPTSGEVILSGYRLSDQSNEIRKKIGLISNQHFLYENLTAFENLKFIGSLYSINSCDVMAIDLLQKVGILNRKDDLVRNLSSGMKQRLSIARALLHNPQVFLLDEPFNGLDIDGVDMFFGILELLKSQGKTILLTTHHFSEGLRLCDKVVVLDKGVIKFEKDSNHIDIKSFDSVYRSIHR